MSTIPAGTPTTREARRAQRREAAARRRRRRRRRLIAAPFLALLLWTFSCGQLRGGVRRRFKDLVRSRLAPRRRARRGANARAARLPGCRPRARGRRLLDRRPRRGDLECEPGACLAGTRVPTRGPPDRR